MNFIKTLQGYFMPKGNPLFFKCAATDMICFGITETLHFASNLQQVHKMAFTLR